MQIVIDIPEEMYKQVSTNDDVYVLDDVDCILIENAIANGTPLPKGHGRLIDADVLSYEKNNHKGEWHFSYITKTQIKKAPTIIEADKEESDADSN